MANAAHLKWFVANSETGECRATLNPGAGHEVFDSRESCANSLRAHLPALAPASQPGGSQGFFICTNSELNQCMRSNVPNTTYHPYATYQDCKSAPECQPSKQQGRAHERPYVPVPAGAWQVPLNPPDRVPVVGNYQVIPGLAGQGYDLMYPPV